jgi:hypothetical protein
MLYGVSIPRLGIKYFSGLLDPWIEYHPGHFALTFA